MPALPCPLGTGCDKGPDGAIWMTIDVPFDNIAVAQKAVEDHVKFAHQAAAAGAATMKAEKLVRPTLTLRDGLIDEEAYEYFLHRWTTYKTQASLTVATKSHLESCLGDEVTLVLFGRLGQDGWDRLDEATLLETVKEVFVKKRNRMVNRLKLQSLMQGPDQPVQQYVASLKQIARTCHYTVKCSREGCNTMVDYSSEMVVDQLVRGLNDPDIQRKVLSSREDDFNLTSVEKLIITEECSKSTQRESKTTLPSEQISALSTYKKSKRAPNKSQELKCSNCGSNTHKSWYDLDEDKKKECKAHNKYCETCGRKNHLAAVCRNKDHEDSGDEAAEHNQLFLAKPGAGDLVLDSISAAPGVNSPTKSKPRTQQNSHTTTTSRITLGHIRYDPARGQFTTGHPHPSSSNSITVDIFLDKDGYRDLHGVNRSLLRGTKSYSLHNIAAVADTGAAVCCVPTAAAAKMGIKMSDTFKSRIVLYAAGNKRLKIRGCLPVVISTLQSDGARKETKEFIYFVENIKNVFLSQDALKDLGSLSPSFPQTQTMTAGNHSASPISDKLHSYAEILK